MFLVYVSDLKALGKDNSLIKFADDCTLIVPAVGYLMCLLSQK